MIINLLTIWSSYYLSSPLKNKEKFIEINEQLVRLSNHEDIWLHYCNGLSLFMGNNIKDIK